MSTIHTEAALILRAEKAEAEAAKAWDFEHKMMLRATEAEAERDKFKEALRDIADGKVLAKTPGTIVGGMTEAGWKRIQRYQEFARAVLLSQ